MPTYASVAQAAVPVPLTGRLVDPPGDLDRRAGARLFRRLPPEWPLVALFAGYPLWWILGITEIASTLLCLAMVVILARSRPVRLPRAFWIWALFLCWVALGIFVVQVDAPGAVEGLNPARYLTWGYRFLWYLRGTAVLLFVGNVLRTRTLEQISRALAWMFLWTVLGGLLGSLWPTANFPSLVELILPRGLTSNAFVSSLVHPKLAEVQVYVTERNRPSAPFPYANVWGVNFACFLPFFVHGWLGPGARWRRWIGVPVLLLAVVPVILSLNRALWFSLILVAVFVAVRSACFGHFRALIGLLIGATMVTVVLAGSPLGQVISTRFNSPNSNQGRTHLALLGVESMSEGSPVIGFGTTRDVQGSFTSIAVGSTEACPRCSPPSLGTQGQLSLVTFTQGWGGAVLYLGFLLFFLMTSLRTRTTEAALGLSVLVVHLVTTPVYGADSLPLLAIMTAVALLWHAQAKNASSDRFGKATRRSIDTVEDARSFVRRHSPAIAVATIAGCFGGAAWQAHDGIPQVATASVLLPAAPGYPGTLGPPMTLDTEAQLAETAAVTDAVRRAAPRASARGVRLRITVTANTRIINLSFRGSDRAGALRAVDAASEALLDQRRDQLVARRKLALSTLKKQSASLSGALNIIDHADSILDADPNLRPGNERVLNRQRFALLAQIERASTQAARVDSAPLSAGSVLSKPSVRPARDADLVRPASGLALGLAAGLAIAWLIEGITGGRSLVEGASRSLRRARHRRLTTPTPEPVR